MSDLPSPASLHEDDIPAAADPAKNDSDGLDDDSDLSEVDEAQFDNFDPENLPDRPAPVDSENIRAIGVHKRKRLPGSDDADFRDERRSKDKRKKEGKSRKPKKSKKVRDDLALEEDNFSGGEQLEGKRVRKGKGDGERRSRAAPAEDDENDENLTPEERRKRAFEKQLNAALKNPNTRRSRVAGIDLEKMQDKTLMDMRNRMAAAAELDNKAREKGQPAMNKLIMLNEVMELINRNNLRFSVVDPDINLMESVKFFLEPLSDGSLPAYNIQRELFQTLAKLPMTKDTLTASGIGKVMLFYTKSRKVEPRIKLQAERLVRNWMRLILKRPDDYRKKAVMTASINSAEAPASQGLTQQEKVAVAREKALALPVLTNRARVEGGLGVYTVAPRSNLEAVGAPRQPGQAGEEAFGRLKRRYQAKGKSGR